MKIEAWVDKNIYPATFGSSIRVFHLLKNLTPFADVRVTCAQERREKTAPGEEVGTLKIRRVRPYHPAVFYYLERARLAPLFLAHSVYRRWPRSLLTETSETADVWQIDSLSLTGLLDHAPGHVLKVYSSQNVETEWFERVGAPLVAKAHWARVLEDIERRAVLDSDLVLAVSEADRKGFIKRYGGEAEKIKVIENGYDAESLHPPTADERAQARSAFGFEKERIYLFAGSDFLHNRKAVDDLFIDLVPRLSELGGKLVLAGTISDRYSARATQEGRDRVLLFAPRADLTPLLWASDVGLNPITTGAGSNVKVPTYLGAGLPVLSTPFGVRGYEKIMDFVTQGPISEFVDRLAEGVPYDPAVQRPLVHYSWQKLAARVAGLYQECLERETGASAELSSGAAPKASPPAARNRAKCAS